MGQIHVPWRFQLYPETSGQPSVSVLVQFRPERWRWRPAAGLAHEGEMPWVGMGTWLKTTESPFTREMCSMDNTKMIEGSTLRWTARKGLSALLAVYGGVRERETW